MKYNMSELMLHAWRIYRKGGLSFAEALHRAWLSAKAAPINAKRIEAAKAAAGIVEQTETWSGWKALGYEVQHGSKALFQTVLIYASKGDTSPQTEIWEMMRGVTKENKIIALTENGVVPDPEQLYSTTTRWAWFATWNGEFAVNMTELGVSDYTPEEKLVKFYNSERVLTLDELPDLKSYPIAGAAK